MTKKNRTLLIFMAAILVIAVGIAGYFLWNQLANREEAPSSAPATHKDYNTSATDKALKNELISKNEVLLLETVEKLPNGDCSVTFRIFSVTDDADPKTYLGLDAEEAYSNGSLLLVGSASAKFLKESPSGIYGLQVAHDR